MCLLAGDVIDSARDGHAAFDRERAPQMLCLRLLSDYAIYLHGRLMEIDEDMLREEATFTLPLDVFPDGIALPANRTVVAVTIADLRVPVPKNFDIDLVPANLRNDINTPAAAAWQIGGKLYLRGAASDWTSYGSVAVSFVAIPVLVTRSSQVIDLPDTAASCLADAVAWKLALRGMSKADADKLPPINLAGFADAAKKSEQAFLDEARNRLTARTYQTRDVMRYFD